MDYYVRMLEKRLILQQAGEKAPLLDRAQAIGFKSKPIRLIGTESERPETSNRRCLPHNTALLIN